MNSKNLFPSLLLLFSTAGFSQEDNKPQITEITKATFFNPGVSYEKPIGKSQSLYAQVFVNTSFGLGYSSSLGNTSFIYLDPAFTIQYRYYYNYAKREANGKRTAMNSLNYLCSILQTTFSKEAISNSYYPETKRRAINIVGLAWGFQRNYQNRFSLDLNLGGGYLYTKVTTIDDMGQFISKNAGQFTTVGQLNLGFWLNKRK
ncbi:MAG: hypothetical protein ABIT05_05220 [Chitinophagaceae bacterium]